MCIRDRGRVHGPDKGVGRLAGGLIAGDVPLCAGDFWGGVDWGGVVPLCAGDFRGGVVLSGIDARALGAWWWGCAGYVSGCGRLMGLSLIHI